ncbi:MAG: hypothetical protein KKB81_03080 [Candidatus Margulisbacteria bacterium]|nr:hypothetical protein [Candidatus Margulisiibacteriota bacterium]MBU1022228.1 hypothetical protein [Candidatus Margulisiibacteriota bacterium]MBU1729333.1 hypothetical protein [Candidatus Margulisiibacteriota bacterium]MBU1955606.1 hypothetical protein [Candidatus Margulisiibacteriota bacterium]
MKYPNNPKKNILFITNGHGEDAVAAEIIKNLPAVNISVMPLVGAGKAFENLYVNILGNPRALPSGGFSFRNLSFLVRDLAAGLLPDIFGKRSALKKLKNEFALVVGIGDIISLVFSKLTKAPLIYVGVNKSSYYQSYGFDYTNPEKKLIKNRAKIAFVRDALTQETLKMDGIDAQFIGNPLMDCINFSQKIEIDRHKTYITLLPGSHQDAIINYSDLLDVSNQIIELNPQKEIEFLMPVPSTVYEKLSAKRVPSIKLLNGYFGVALSAAKIVIGLAGSANEQAAGLGKPVIAFPGKGSQYTQKFAQAQKQLLGEALLITTKEAAAKAATDLFNNETKLARMTKEGKSRMVKNNACEKIALSIKELLAS